MSFIRSLADISSKDVASAGGKGASLGEMINAGIPVPPGFVVVAKAFDAFLKETELVTEIDAMLGRVNINAMHTVEDASEKIQALIENATMPTDIAKEILKAHKTLGARFVAVRSSATAEDSAAAAWAGQLETHLNVQEKTLLKEVQKCWASLFSPRAIFYRFEQKLQKKKISADDGVEESR
jgi:pyruvate,water dikinase